MKRSKWLVRIVVVAAVAAAVTVVVVEVRAKKRVADAAVHDIEAQLDDLDPLTRAAVIARVGADQARRN